MKNSVYKTLNQNSTLCEYFSDQKLAHNSGVQFLSGLINFNKFLALTFMCEILNFKDIIITKTTDHKTMVLKKTKGFETCKEQGFTKKIRFMTPKYNSL